MESRSTGWRFGLLAEKLNAGTVLMDWAEAIHDGEQVIDELTLKLADESDEDDDA